MFPLQEFSYIKRYDCVSADSNFNTIINFAISSNTFKNGRMQHYPFEIEKSKKKFRNCYDLDTCLIMLKVTFKHLKKLKL